MEVPHLILDKNVMELSRIISWNVSMLIFMHQILYWAIYSFILLNLCFNQIFLILGLNYLQFHFIF